jgi:hypothetical protein
VSAVEVNDHNGIPVNKRGRIVSGCIQYTSPDVVRSRIGTSLSDILKIKNPSKELQQLVYKIDPTAIDCIKDLHKDIQLDILANHPEHLPYITNMCPEVQMYLAQIDPMLIASQDNLTPEIQLLAVQTDPAVIGLFENPHPEVIKWLISNC